MGLEDSLIDIRSIRPNGHMAKTASQPASQPYVYSLLVVTKYNL